MKTVKFLFLTVTAVLMIGCSQSNFMLEGTVRDFDTNEPIDSVLCKSITIGNAETYTDSLGRYYLKGSNKCIFSSCPKKTIIEYSKKGYITKRVELTSELKGITLKKK